MNIRWQDDAVYFSDLDEFLADLFRKLPDSACPDDERARMRLLGAPTGGKDPDADAEWREVVEPELRELFQTNVDVVAEDLDGMRPSGEDGELELRVPSEHVRAWVHTLNQARLALGARHDVTEADMEGRRPIEDEEKAFALFQIEMYGLILSLLLRNVEI